MASDPKYKHHLEEMLIFKWPLYLWSAWYACIHAYTWYGVCNVNLKSIFPKAPASRSMVIYGATTAAVLLMYVHELAVQRQRQSVSGPIEVLEPWDAIVQETERGKRCASFEGSSRSEKRIITLVIAARSKPGSTCCKVPRKQAHAAIET